MADWQPIESAPRDGTRLRLGHEMDVSSMKIGAFCETHGHWDGERWITSSFFIIPGGRYGLATGQPTHWMPLPPPPQGHGHD